MQKIRSQDLQAALQEAIKNPSLIADVARLNSQQPPGVQQQDMLELKSMMTDLQSQFQAQSMQVISLADSRRPAATPAGSDMAVAVRDPSLDVADGPAVAHRVEQMEHTTQLLERSLMELSTNIADMDLRINMCEVAAYDGILTWKVTRWTERRRDAVTGRNISIYSPPFFTSYHGYKCCIRLYPNGDGIGQDTHASVFFVIMQNDYDPVLEWPFNRRVTFSLLNQIPGRDNITETFRPDTTSNSFQRPVAAMNVASGCPTFAEVRKIEDPGEGFMADDDCLFIRVEVAKTSFAARFPDGRTRA